MSHETAPDIKEREPRPIFLSPHLDDAVLSCGGLIHQQCELGRHPLVITVFAGIPDYTSLSPFAAELHRQWGQTADPLRQRRYEDEAALTCLGADHEQWDYMDCIYRRNPVTGEYLYATEEALFGDPHPADSSLVEQLVTRLSTLALREASCFLVPLAVGHHVDHQLLRRVALQNGAVLFSTCCFEDYPYAKRGEALSVALAAWESPPTAHIQPLSEDDLSAKISAILCYRSQLKVLFGHDAKVDSDVRSYSLCVGGGAQSGERYWLGGGFEGPHRASYERETSHA